MYTIYHLLLFFKQELFSCYIQYVVEVSVVSQDHTSGPEIIRDVNVID